MNEQQVRDLFQKELDLDLKILDIEITESVQHVQVTFKDLEVFTICYNYSENYLRPYELYGNVSLIFIIDLLDERSI